MTIYFNNFDMMPYNIVTIVFGKIISLSKTNELINFDERIPSNDFESIKVAFDTNPQLKRCPSKIMRKYYSTDCVRIVEKGGKLVDQYKIVKQNIKFIQSDIIDKYILFEERSKKEIDSNTKERDLILEQEIVSYHLLQYPDVQFDFIKENDIRRICVIVCRSNDTDLKECVTMIEKFFK